GARARNNIDAGRRSESRRRRCPRRAETEGPAPRTLTIPTSLVIRAHQVIADDAGFARDASPNRQWTDLREARHNEELRCRKATAPVKVKGGGASPPSTTRRLTGCCRDRAPSRSTSGSDAMASELMLAFLILTPCIGGLVMALLVAVLATR